MFHLNMGGWTIAVIAALSAIALFLILAFFHGANKKQYIMDKNDIE